MEALLSQFIKFFIFINLIAHVLSLSCNLKYFNENWLNDWSVILADDGKSQHQLFRDHSIAAKDDILMVCNNNYEPIRVSCNTDQSFNETIPLNTQCPENESLLPVRIAEKTASCPYTLYKIGFNIEINSHTQFLETYRVCFDQKHMRPLYTINKVYPVGGGRPSFLQFNPDDIFYGRHFSAFSRRASFERFKTLLGNNQQYMSASNVDHIIDRGHLTPSADFTLTNLKRSTFNMINVIPQFKTIDNGNWRLIEEWTRHRSRTPGNVCTGVLDCKLDSQDNADLSCVVKLKDASGNSVPMFLADNSKIPIPLWSYKIVKNSENSLVFLTLNNIYHKGDVPVPEHICQQIECPIKLSKTVRAGRTFCCNYSDFIDRSVPYLKEVC